MHFVFAAARRTGERFGAGALLTLFTAQCIVCGAAVAAPRCFRYSSIDQQTLAHRSAIIVSRATHSKREEAAIVFLCLGCAGSDECLCHEKSKQNRMSFRHFTRGGAEKS